MTLGNTKNLDVAQRMGAASNKRRFESKAGEIADALAELSYGISSSAAEIVDFLNGRGIVTGRGTSWTVSALRRPLTRAKQIMEERSAAHNAAIPGYGRFS